MSRESRAYSYTEKGLEHMRAQRWDKAEKEFRRANALFALVGPFHFTDTHATYVNLTHCIGMCLYHRFNYESACVELEAAAQIAMKKEAAGDYSTTPSSMSMSYVLVCLENLGRYEDVVERAPLALRTAQSCGRKQDFVMCHRFLAGAYQGLGRTSEALVHIKAAFDNAPGDELVYALYAELWRRVGESATAKEVLKEAVHAGLSGSRPVLVERCWLAVEELNRPEAAALLPKLGAREDTQARLEGLLQAETGDHRQALESYEAALRRAPNSWYLLAEWLDELRQVGTKAQVLRGLEKLQEKSGGNAEAFRRQARVLWSLGECGRAEELYRQASSRLEALLKEKPGRGVEMYTLAWLLVTTPVPGLRNGLRAEELLKQVLTLAGSPCEGYAGSSRHLSAASAICAEIGDFASAVSFGRAALKRASPLYKPRYEARLRIISAGHALQDGIPYEEPYRGSPSARSAVPEIAVDDDDVDGERSGGLGEAISKLLQDGETGLLYIGEEAPIRIEPAGSRESKPEKERVRAMRALLPSGTVLKVRLLSGEVEWLRSPHDEAATPTSKHDTETAAPKDRKPEHRKRIRRPVPLLAMIVALPWVLVKYTTLGLLKALPLIVVVLALLVADSWNGYIDLFGLAPSVIEVPSVRAFFEGESLY